MGGGRTLDYAAKVVLRALKRDRQHAPRVLDLGRLGLGHRIGVELMGMGVAWMSDR